MATSSKDLLPLEHKEPSISPLESKLLVRKNESLAASQRKNDQSDKKPITAPLPKSQLLGKVRNFLGVMSEANEKLQIDAKDNPEKYDIEVLTGEESEVIDLECMCGMFDLLAPEAVAAAEAAVSGYQPVMQVTISSSEEESDDSSSDEEDSSCSNGDDACNEDNKPSSYEGKLKTSKAGKSDSLSEEVSNKKRPKKGPKIVELS